MPKASRTTASDSMQMEGYEGHYENFDGGYTVAFETGDAYYMPAGHTPVLYAGTEIIEFSPTKDLQQTMDVVAKNMEGAAA